MENNPRVAKNNQKETTVQKGLNRDGTLKNKYKTTSRDKKWLQDTKWKQSLKKKKTHDDQK